jgi:hypothetical protein
MGERPNGSEAGCAALAEEVARLATDEQDRTAREELMADMEAVASDCPE